ERRARRGLVPHHGRLADERRAWSGGTERARRAGRARISVGIECVRPSRPWRGARLRRGQWRFRDVRPRRAALGAVAKAVFHVLAEFLQLRLESALPVLQFLDPAVGLAKRLLESVDAQQEPRRFVRTAFRSTGNVGRRRSLTVENVELRLSRRCKREAGGQPRDETKAKRRRHGGVPDCPCSTPSLRLASVDFKSRARFRAPWVNRDSQLPAAPLSTVTARRFWDQHEMSSQTATGRSLP